MATFTPSGDDGRRGGVMRVLGMLVALGVAAGACSGDSDDDDHEVPQSCQDIIDVCHEAEEAGVEGAADCHETGHGGDEAACDADHDACVALCSATGEL
jgi:hypothetical protein